MNARVIPSLKNISDQIVNRLQENMLNIAVLGCYINPVEADMKLKELQLTRFANFIDYKDY